VNGNDRAITALVMVGHALVHTYEMTIPLFVVLWLQQFEVISLGVITVGVTTATIGAIVTVSYGLFGLGALPGGILVDYVGSRTLIAGCLLGMGVAFLVLGLAPSMLLVTVALVLWGLAASVYHPAGLSLISRGVSERGTGLAYHGIAGNVGIGIGPLVVATLLLVFEWRTVAVGLALPAILATLYATQVRFDPTAAVTDRERGPGTADNDTTIASLRGFLTQSSVVFTAGFALVFVIVIASGLYYRGVLTFLPELLRGLPGFEPIAVSELLPGWIDRSSSASPAGAVTVRPQDYFYSGLLAVGILGQYVGGKLTDRIPVEYGLAAAFGVLVVLAVAFVPVSTLGIGPLVILGSFLGVFLFVVQPMYQAAVAEYTHPESRGLSYGYTYVGVFGIGALGGVVAGTILQYASPTVLFATLAGVALAGSITALFLARRG
jgi:MFS family permease